MRNGLARRHVGVADAEQRAIIRALNIRGQDSVLKNFIQIELKKHLPEKICEMLHLCGP